MPYPQATHIFPYSMIYPPAKADKGKASRYIPGFWKLVPLFWDKGRVMEWRRKIFSDPENPDLGVEGCFNLISFTPTAHDIWNRGLFALKPLKLSRDKKKLTVQFFWQVPGNYDPDSQVDLLTEPTSSKDLNLLPNGCFLHRVNDDGSSLPIQSGDTFTFTTKDPKNLPLPSLELLEMQWVLQRLVGMCGAAGWPSLDSIEDDSIDGVDGWFTPDRFDYIVHNSSDRVRE
jgi:HNH endonuclease